MKKKNLISIQIGVILALSLSVKAAVYDTLPKGVNTLVIKHVETSTIKSKYDSQNTQQLFEVEQEFNSTTLEKISDSIKTYFDHLKSISPEAYQNFSLGEFKAKAAANVQAQGIGIGRGLTNRLTIYGSLPVYHVSSDVNFYQTKGGTLSQIQAKVKTASANSPLENFIRELTLQLPQAKEELLQSVLTNYFKYKPLGHWQKDTLGDAEVGMIYRLTDSSDKGFAIGAGAVLPTGTKDDPDSLQDIATGDGQYDYYVEAMLGVSFFKNNLIQFDLKGRYTYQEPTSKELRLIDSSEYPLAVEKGKIKEKLGDKYDATAQLTLNPTHWLNINSAAILNIVKSSKYETDNQAIKTALETNTKSENVWGRLGLGISSVEAYKRKYLDIPAEINLSAQKLLNGKNAARYDRYDLELRLYF